MSDIVTLNGYKIKDEKAVRTYDTVALLKADTKLKVGQHVKTRGYYLINDGGSAEYYITDNQSNTKYQEELNNGLYATLISDSFINIKQLGAKGDGETDDSPIIRKAIAYLKILGGGTLYLPIGTYYVNSGDPRGMNTGESFSKEDYYTCFELIDNLNVIGDGDNSVILYNSNRIGYNTQTSRGDVGAIFANFRVNGTENYHVRGKLKFENLVYQDISKLTYEKAVYCQLPN